MNDTQRDSLRAAVTTTLLRGERSIIADTLHMAIASASPQQQPVDWTTQPPADAAMQHAARTKFAKASVQLMLNKKTAFYSALLMEMKIVWTDTLVWKGGVDMYNRLYLNYRGIEECEVPQIVFLLVHELEHILRLHPHRVENRDHQRWNIAGDMVINADLDEYSIGTFIEGGILTPEHKGRLTETVYNELPVEEQGGGGGGEGGQGGEGEGDDSGQPGQGDEPIGGTGDDLLEGDPLNEGKGEDGEGKQQGPMTNEQRRQLEAKTKGLIAKAAQAARVAGDLSVDMQRRIEEVLDVKTPWYEILERCMTERAEQDYAWTRPNRRFIGAGIYLPSMDSIGTLGEIGVIRDTSGSCHSEQPVFVGHLNNIMERCKPTGLHLLDTTTRVHKPRYYTADEMPINPTVEGTGGTHLTAGFDWLRDNVHDKLACIIVLTDGYTDWPDYHPDCPVFILCTTDTDVSYGDETIRFDMED